MTQLLLSATSLTASSANLAEALARVEARLDAWAANTSAYNSLLQQVFAAAGTDAVLWQQAAAALQGTLTSTGLAIPLELLEGDQLAGINGAYTAGVGSRRGTANEAGSAARTNGGERIYPNGAWLQSASAEQVEAVLLEELGHAIDSRINGSDDSPGDEGAIFSALLRGYQPTAASFLENDQRQIVVGGVLLAVEADTTPPVARTTTPAFAAETVTSFGLAHEGFTSSPSIVDIDGDGDLDVFIGTNSGDIHFFRNTAAAGATAPAFAAASANPFGLEDVGGNASPSFVDIDGDGDLDAFIGNGGNDDYDGNTLFFRNTAVPGAITPAFAAAITNPFGLSDVGDRASPSFVDIDGDGDLDVFIGEINGNTIFFRNTAVPGATRPAFAAALTNPFGLSDVGFVPSKSFVDIDGDGDLDAFISNFDGNTLFFRNTAAPGAADPAFAAAATSPFGLTDVGSYASATFVDIDDDGDLDAFIGNRDGSTLFFRNTAPALGVSSTTANGTYGPGAVITLTVRFSESVVVTGAPRLQLETGSTDRFATFTSGSGTNTLTFSYTVQPGDTSADLDLLSAAALSLNGGTIHDAAGNNAALILAAPGEPGSLAARKALVIAGASISGVTSPAADGPYPTGALINITVSFSQAVLVNGMPRLTLETGDTDRFATYTAGSGTSTLTFTYTVQPGDTTADLDAISINALALNGGSIRDMAFGNNASLTLPAPGAASTLGATKNLGIDGVTPVARATTPAFASGIITPFGLSNAGYSASPSFVDIDGDGDLDVFIGNQNGNTLFFRNTAGPGTSTPAYTAALTNPFGLSDVGDRASPSFVDIDGDGDLDAFIGQNDGNTLFFRNTAAPGTTTPAFATATTNPFGLTDVGVSARSTFTDIDGDGDLDIFIGEYFGNTLFFRNTGAPGATAPTFAAALTNPFGLRNVEGYRAHPSFADIDGDGDLDVFIGNRFGNTLFFRNTAAPGATAPTFAAAISNPFGLADVGDFAKPRLVDIDGDGDLDAFIGERFGNTLFFQNTAPALGVSSTTPNGTYAPGAVITLTVRFSENVFVTGAPRPARNREHRSLRYLHWRLRHQHPHLLLHRSSRRRIH